MLEKNRLSVGLRKSVVELAVGERKFCYRPLLCSGLHVMFHGCMKAVKICPRGRPDGRTWPIDQLLG